MVNRKDFWPVRTGALPAGPPPSCSGRVEQITRAEPLLTFSSKLSLMLTKPSRCDGLVKIPGKNPGKSYANTTFMESHAGLWHRKVPGWRGFLDFRPLMQLIILSMLATLCPPHLDGYGVAKTVPAALSGLFRSSWLCSRPYGVCNLSETRV